MLQREVLLLVYCLFRLRKEKCCIIFISHGYLESYRCKRTADGFHVETICSSRAEIITFDLPYAISKRHHLHSNPLKANSFSARKSSVRQDIIAISIQASFCFSAFPHFSEKSKQRTTHLISLEFQQLEIRKQINTNIK